MRARDLMTAGAYTCSLHDTLNTAAKIMWDHDCGAVPVVDYYGHVVAMLTDRDISMAAYMQGGTLSHLPVASACSSVLYAAREDTEVEEIERMMTEHQVRRIPIVDAEGRPAGIVSMHDLIRQYRSPCPPTEAHRLVRMLQAIGDTPKTHAEAAE